MVLCDSSPTNQHRVSQAPAVSGLSGEGSVSKHTHVVVGRIHLLAGSWTGHLCCSEAIWETPMGSLFATWQLAFSEPASNMGKTKRGARESRSPVFCNPISKVTSHHFCCILIVGSESLGPTQHWRGGDLYKEVGLFEGYLRGCQPHLVVWGFKSLQIYICLYVYLYNKKKKHTRARVDTHHVVMITCNL